MKYKEFNTTLPFSTFRFYRCSPRRQLDCGSCP